MQRRQHGGDSYGGSYTSYQDGATLLPVGSVVCSFESEGDLQCKYFLFQPPIFQSILPSLLLLTCGALAAAYFSARLDVIEKEIAERLHYLENAIDKRLDRLEDEVKEGQKGDKKNDFKTKALCKLAGLFNNPLYDICQEGFDSSQIIGHSGYGGHGSHGGDGIQQF